MMRFFLYRIFLFATKTTESIIVFVPWDILLKKEIPPIRKRKNPPYKKKKNFPPNTPFIKKKNITPLIKEKELPPKEKILSLRSFSILMIAKNHLAMSRSRIEFE